MGEDELPDLRSCDRPAKEVIQRPLWHELEPLWVSGSRRDRGAAAVEALEVLSEALHSRGVPMLIRDAPNSSMKVGRLRCQEALQELVEPVGVLLASRAKLLSNEVGCAPVVPAEGKRGRLLGKDSPAPEGATVLLLGKGAP